MFTFFVQVLSPGRLDLAIVQYRVWLLTLMALVGSIMGMRSISEQESN